MSHCFFGLFSSSLNIWCTVFMRLLSSSFAAMKVCDGDEENSMLSLTASQDGAPPEAVNDPLRVDWPKVKPQPATTHCWPVKPGSNCTAIGLILG